jgi:hypothetical protein
MIRGFEVPSGSRLADANHLLSGPGFWSEYLLSTARVEGLFDDAGRGTMREALQDGENWPVLSVRLLPTGGHHRWLRIVYRNFDDDAGIDYLIASDLGGTAIPIAAIEGHFRGPGLCWEELLALAGMPDPQLTRAQRFLLALPLLGDAAAPGDAPAVIAAVLQELDAVDHSENVAGQLLQTWEPAEWVIRQGVRMCLGRHSPRHVQDLSLRQLHEVDEALGGRFCRARNANMEYRFGRAGRSVPRWRFEVADSRVESGVGVRLAGRLDGEIRDGEVTMVGNERRVAGLDFAGANGSVVLVVEGDVLLERGTVLWPID